MMDEIFDGSSRSAVYYLAFICRLLGTTPTASKRAGRSGPFESRATVTAIYPGWQSPGDGTWGDKSRRWENHRQSERQIDFRLLGGRDLGIIVCYRAHPHRRGRNCRCVFLILSAAQPSIGIYFRSHQHPSTISVSFTGWKGISKCLLHPSVCSTHFQTSGSWFRQSNAIYSISLVNK